MVFLLLRYNLRQCATQQCSWLIFIIREGSFFNTHLQCSSLNNCQFVIIISNLLWHPRLTSSRLWESVSSFQRWLQSQANSEQSQGPVHHGSMARVFCLHHTFEQNAFVLHRPKRKNQNKTWLQTKPLEKYLIFFTLFSIALLLKERIAINHSTYGNLDKRKKTLPLNNGYSMIILGQFNLYQCNY